MLVNDPVNVFATFLIPIPVEVIISRPIPAIIAYKLVPSPPNPVVFAPRCGINTGAVEEEAPEPTDGDVVRTEFIISPVTQLHQVTEAGVIA